MAQCIFPYYVENKVYHHQEDRFIPVPCGQCPECTKRRAHSWAFRLEKEAQNYIHRYFLTLTYDNLHLPLTPKGYATLRKSDVQKFLKRIRKKTKELKYYYVGEYGTRRKRPHYHMILFSNERINDLIIDEWFHGNVHFGKAEEGSIYYTIQYYDKGDWHSYGIDDDRMPEFSNMSKGMGQDSALVDYVGTRADTPFLYYNGKKIAIPRYYKKKLFEKSPQKQQEFLLKAKIKGKNEKDTEQASADARARFEYIKNYRREQRSRRGDK